MNLRQKIAFIWRWRILDYAHCLNRELWRERHAWWYRITNYRTCSYSREWVNRLFTKNYWLYDIRWVCPKCKVSWCAFIGKDGDLTCACGD